MNATTPAQHTKSHGTGTHGNDAHGSVWQEAFSPAEQQRQLQEDSNAWRGVTGLLMAVVGLGALSGAVVVALISLYG